MPELIIQASSADPDEYLLSGQLIYENAKQCLKSGSDLFTNGDAPLCLNFSEVNRVDTAGIAVILAWVRDSQHRQQGLVIKHLPQQAKALIENSGLSHLLPIA